MRHCRELTVARVALPPARVQAAAACKAQEVEGIAMSARPANVLVCMSKSEIATCENKGGAERTYLTLNSQKARERAVTSRSGTDAWASGSRFGLRVSSITTAMFDTFETLLRISLPARSDRL